MNEENMALGMVIPASYMNMSLMNWDWGLNFFSLFSGKLKSVDLNVVYPHFFALIRSLHDESLKSPLHF